MIADLIFGLLIGFLCGYGKLLGYLDENHPEVYKKLNKDTKDWWNALLDSFKAETKQDKIDKLEKQIETLKEE